MESHIQAIFEINAILSELISIPLLKEAASKDVEYQELLDLIKEGFPRTRNATQSQYRIFGGVRDRLSLLDGLALMNDRPVIPNSM